MAAEKSGAHMVPVLYGSPEFAFDARVRICMGMKGDCTNGYKPHVPLGQLAQPLRDIALRILPT